ncbi:MAG: cupin domain-containing protein [Bacteroidales bacterium]|nr:cupin domain-containing protein [Bacteroidales bacterium]
MENEKIQHGTPFVFADSISYQTDGIVSKRIIQKEKGNITLFAFDAGQKLSEHTAPFDALVQVMAGSAEIVIGGKPNQLAAGQSIIMPANVPHAVNANERFIMLLTMIRE